MASNEKQVIFKTKKTIIGNIKELRIELNGKLNGAEDISIINTEKEKIGIFLAYGEKRLLSNLNLHEYQKLNVYINDLKSTIVDTYTDNKKNIRLPQLIKRIDELVQYNFAFKEWFNNNGYFTPDTPKINMTKENKYFDICEKISPNEVSKSYSSKGELYNPLKILQLHTKDKHWEDIIIEFYEVEEVTIQIGDFKDDFNLQTLGFSDKRKHDVKNNANKAWSILLDMAVTMNKIGGVEIDNPHMVKSISKMNIKNLKDHLKSVFLIQDNPFKKKNNILQPNFNLRYKIPIENLTDNKDQYFR